MELKRKSKTTEIVCLEPSLQLLGILGMAYLYLLSQTTQKVIKHIFSQYFTVIIVTTDFVRNLGSTCLK